MTFGDRMLTPAEVADALGFEVKAIRRAIARGELAATKVCGRIKIEPAAVRAWLDAGRVEPERAAAAAPVTRAAPARSAQPARRATPGERGSFRERVRRSRAS